MLWQAINNTGMLDFLQNIGMFRDEPNSNISEEYFELLSQLED